MGGGTGIHPAEGRKSHPLPAGTKGPWRAGSSQRPSPILGTQLPGSQTLCCELGLWPQGGWGWRRVDLPQGPWVQLRAFAGDVVQASALPSW